RRFLAAGSQVVFVRAAGLLILTNDGPGTRHTFGGEQDLEGLGAAGVARRGGVSSQSVGQRCATGWLDGRSGAVAYADGLRFGGDGERADRFRAAADRL